MNRGRAAQAFTPIGEMNADGHARLIALNNDHAAETSYLSSDAWRALIGTSFRAWATTACDAFLISCDQGADYDSSNFLWFRDKYTQFVYVDRIVVAPTARGRGYARALYEKLFADARRAGHARIVCEVNTDPPNPGSDAFHAALGFVEVGHARLASRNKSVRYLVRDLGPDNTL